VDSDGATGIGEAAGPSIPLIEAALAQEFVDLVRGSELDDWRQTLASLRAYSCHWPRVGNHAVAGLEMALLDLTARRSGIPAAHLVGAPRAPRIRFSGYLFIDRPDANAAQARAYVAQGFDELKIKVGRDLDLDVRRLDAIRAAVGPAVGLKVDANMGWDLPLARRAVDALGRFGLLYVEQPIHDGNLAGLRELRAACGVPIAVDESVRTLGDALRLIEARACDVFVVYTPEAGGLHEAGHIARVAAEAGIACCLGTWGESGLGMAASTAFLGGQPNFPFANDTHYGLLDADIVAQPFRFVGGRAEADLGSTGWGVTLDAAAIARFGTDARRERVFTDPGA
jgi:L-alanine-DL-glutamate epimerase-like enolase superfamily enzyme